MLLDILEMFTVLLKLGIIMAASLGTTALKILPVFSLESIFFSLTTLLIFKLNNHCMKVIYFNHISQYAFK